MYRVFVSLLTAVVLFCTAVPARAQATQTGFVTVNGAQIFYTSTGTGIPMMLIHGYPLSGDLFTFQRSALSQLFRVITIDQRGFGRSVAPNPIASVDIYSNDVLGVMNALNIQQAVIGGHSLGGIVTLDVYRKAPQRFLGMLLIDTIAAPAPTIEKMMWRGYAQQSAEEGAESLLPLLLPEMFTGQTRVSQPGFPAGIANLVRQASLFGLIGGANALADRPDLRPVLPTISVPTLIIVGLEDSLTPVEVSRQLNAAIPRSALAIFPGASHAAIAEVAGAVNSAILAAARGIGIR